MSNSIFNALNNTRAINNTPANAPIDPKFQTMMQQFNEFSRTFTGDPEQIVKGMLQSGKMSQAQYESICKPAQTLYNLIFHR